MRGLKININSTFKMKEIGIGDLHGYGGWKKIVKENKDADMTVFIGDYFDSLTIPVTTIIENFKEIIDYKRAKKDKCKLLIGNHSFHYLRTSHKKYVGYQKYWRADISELIHNALDEGLMQMCYLSENRLYSHAGVTNEWCTDNNIDMNNIEQSINDLFTYKPNSFEIISGGEPHGDEWFNSPIWVRPRSLRENRVDGYIHIVGHTVQDKLIINDDIVLIDTLGTSGEYLQVIDGVFTARTIGK